MKYKSINVYNITRVTYFSEFNNDDSNTVVNINIEIILNYLM